VPSRYLWFPDENHWVSQARNSRLWYATVLGWIAQWTAPLSSAAVAAAAVAAAAAAASAPTGTRARQAAWVDTLVPMTGLRVVEASGAVCSVMLNQTSISMNNNKCGQPAVAGAAAVLTVHV
jgi:hypothetical protein